MENILFMYLLGSMLLVAVIGLTVVGHQLTPVSVYNPNLTHTASFTSQLSVAPNPSIGQIKESKLSPSAILVSNRWLGYAIGFGENVTMIQANWTVNPVTNHTAIQWIGIQSANTGRLVQVGISENQESNSYFVFYERYPNEDMIKSFNISVGDSITASITRMNSNQTSNITQWNIYLKDITTNQSLSRILAYKISAAEPFWIIEAPYLNILSSSQPLGNFSNDNFTGVSATIDGTVHNLCSNNLIQYSINASISNITSCTSFSLSNP